jgi:hypothetical protein
VAQAFQPVRRRKACGYIFPFPKRRLSKKLAGHYRETPTLLKQILNFVNHKGINRDYAAGLPAAVQKWFWEANPPSLTSTSFLFCSQIVSWKP